MEAYRMKFLDEIYKKMETIEDYSVPLTKHNSVEYIDSAVLEAVRKCTGFIFNPKRVSCEDIFTSDGQLLSLALALIDECTNEKLKEVLKNDELVKQAGEVASLTIEACARLADAITVLSIKCDFKPLEEVEDEQTREICGKQFELIKQDGLSILSLFNEKTFNKSSLYWLSLKSNGPKSTTLMI